jgi:hypothetical protein
MTMLVSPVRRRPNQPAVPDAPPGSSPVREKVVMTMDVARRLTLAIAIALGLGGIGLLAPPATGAQVSGCHSAYVPTETYCVPYTEYDLNCDDIGWAQVSLYDGWNDPYGLDSVNTVDDWVTCNKAWEGAYGWGDGGSTGSSAAAAPAPAPAGNCDPAYVNYCIPPATAVGDLDCGDMYAQGISWIQLAQIGWDPHGFDLNSDGYGCEG